MNPLLRAQSHYRPAATGAMPRWSVVYAAAVAGDNIVIGAGQSVLFDLVQSPIYGNIDNFGLIVVDQTKDTELRLAGGTVEMGGELRIGTPAVPFPIGRIHKQTFSGARSLEPAGNLTSPATSGIPTSNRGWLFMPGSKRQWYGETPALVVVKLAATAAVGATSITLSLPVTWKANDWIELGATKYVAEGIGTNGYARERVQVLIDVNNSVTVPLATALLYQHHGQMQYLVPNGLEDLPNTNLSYTQRVINATDSFGTVAGTGAAYLGSRVIASITAGAPSTIDNRCTVGHLTRPIRINGVLDTDWTTHGYGATTMVMGLSSWDICQGVEFSRCGKAGQLGAYPLHWHMRSYTRFGQPGSGTVLGDVDATTNYIKRCSVYDSSNRMISIHGTNGAIFEDNIGSNIDTHAVFLEDGSERRWSIQRNFISGVNPIGYGKTPIKIHDTDIGPGENSQTGPSAFWITSPDGTLKDNICSGTVSGIWVSASFDRAFTESQIGLWQKGCFGASRDVLYVPSLEFYRIVHANNESSCSRYRCMATGGSVIDEAGNIASHYIGFRWDPTLNGGSGGQYYGAGIISNANLWKGGAGWYFNQVNTVQYSNWRCAGLKVPAGGQGTFKGEKLGIFGNAGGDFLGWLMVCHTLDDAYPNDRPTLMLSYGNAVARKDSIWVAAEMRDILCNGDHIDSDGGAMSLWDFYIWPLYPTYRSFNNSRNTNNCLLGKSVGQFGFRSPPSFLSRQGQFGTALQTLISTDPVNDVLTDSVGKYSSSVRGNWGAIDLPADGHIFGSTGWWVYNSPYFLYGITGAVDAPAPVNATGLNGKIIPSGYRYYGIQVVEASGVNVLNGVFPAPEVYYTRMQADGVTPVTGGTWNAPRPQFAYTNYGNMRHGVVLDGGHYDISWPNRTSVPLPTSFTFKVDGWGPNRTYSGTHYFFSIDWNGSTPVAVYPTSDGAPLAGMKRCSIQRYSNALGFQYQFFAEVASLTALNASTVASFFVDTTGNKIHLHVMKGSLPESDPDSNAESMFLRINA